MTSPISCNWANILFEFSAQTIGPIFVWVYAKSNTRFIASWISHFWYLMTCHWRQNPQIIFDDISESVAVTVMITLFLSYIVHLWLTSPIDFLLTVLPECLTPKCGFHCYTPCMASFFFFSHGRHLTSCVTSYTAFFSSIAQTIFLFISVLVFLLRTLLGPCAGYTLI